MARSKLPNLSELYEAARDGLMRVGSALGNSQAERAPLSVTAWRNPNLGGAKITLRRIDDVYVRAYDFQPELSDDTEPGPTFVLVHGIGVSAHYFIPLATRLQHFGRVVMMDLPGFSNLPNPSHPLSIAGFARCVDELLKLLEVTNPVILGHSMGAQVVTELLARHPKLSDRTVLLGPPVNAGERNIGDVGLRFIQSSAFESFRLGLVAARAYAACGMAWFMQTVPAMMNYPIEERIEQMDSNLMIVRGGFDYVAPQSWIRTLADHAQIAGSEATTHVVAGAAHSVIYIHPTQVTKVLLQVAQIASPDWLEAEAATELERANKERSTLDAAFRRSIATVAEYSIAGIHSARWLRTVAMELPYWTKVLWQRHVTSAATENPDQTGNADASPNGYPPVILIPGITETWKALEPLAQALREAGFAVWHLPDTGNLARSFAEYAKMLQKFITAHGWDHVLVVAHSKGGLVAKAAANVDPRIERVIALATPWSGSSLAGLAPRWWRRYDELRPGSAPLMQLAQQRSANSRIVSLAAKHDQEVPNGCYLPGARNRRLAVRGHQRLLETTSTYTAVITALKHR